MNSTVEIHIYFWLGVLSAILIGVPVSIGAIFIIINEAIDLAAFSIGALFSLIICLLIAMAFRDRILKKMFGTANTSMTATANSFGDIIFSAASGDLQKAQKHSEEFSRNILSWYAWSSFYKWLIGTGVALLGTFAVFAGTILIVDQNAQLRQGNEQNASHSRNSQTIQMITLSNYNQDLKNDIDVVGNEIRTYLGEEKLTDPLKRSTRNVLNFYEEISTAANLGVLNKEILMEDRAGSMIRLLNYAQSKYLKNSRCKSKEEFARRYFEQFEIFVECEVKKRYKIPVDYPDGAACSQSVRDKIRSENYCN
jgi:hypothetical protein